MSISDLSYCELLSDSSHLSGGALVLGDLTQPWCSFFGVLPHDITAERVSQRYSSNGYSETYRLSGTSPEGESVVGLYSFTMASSS